MEGSGTEALTRRLSKYMVEPVSIRALLTPAQLKVCVPIVLTVAELPKSEVTVRTPPLAQVSNDEKVKVPPPDSCKSASTPEWPYKAPSPPVGSAAPSGICELQACEGRSLPDFVQQEFIDSHSVTCRMAKLSDSPSHDRLN